MCMLQSGKGGITEKAAAMTMLNNTASIPRRRSHFRDQLDSFLLRLGRFINAVPERTACVPTMGDGAIVGKDAEEARLT